MTERTPAYDELSLRIQPDGDNRYRIVVSAPDGSTASGTFGLPFSETELDNFVLRVGRQRMGTRGYRSAQMEEAKQFGSQLFDALMIDGVRDIFRSARGVAESHQKGLRVTLYLTDVPELMGVPWEFLYERPRFLAQSIYSPVVRSLDLGEVRSPHPVTLPLNVLGMVSRPEGLDALDVEREKEKLDRALEPLRKRNLVTLDWLERGTLSQLDEAISRRDGVHVFHYIGHGAYDAREDGGILVLENEHGGPHEVSGEELGSLLQDERSLRLAVLNSCEGARSSHVDPFSGVASSLVQYGIPAVIGMQFEITDEAAIVFAARLYTSLAEGYPVDAALAQSRRSIFAAGNDIEFGTPVLFLRGADARLFDLENPVPPEMGAEIDAAADLHRLSPRPSQGSAPSAAPPAQPLPPPPSAQPAPPPRPPPSGRPLRPPPSGPATPILPSLVRFLQALAPPIDRVLRRRKKLSTREIAIASAVVFAIGCIVGLIYSDTPRHSTGRDVAGMIFIISFAGLIWAAVRAVRDFLNQRRDRS